MNATIRVRDLMLLALLVGSLAAFRSAAPSPKWEYTSAEFLTTAFFGKINELGRDGWEMVTCADQAYSGGTILRCWFKRPVP